MKVIAGKKLETKPEIKSATNNKNDNEDFEENEEQIDPIKKEEKEQKKDPQIKVEIEKKDDTLEKIEIKFNDLSKDMESKGLFEQQKLLKEILEKTKKIKNRETELLYKGKKVYLEIRIKEFIEKYLTEEKIKTYLEQVKFKELINLKNTLISLEQELKQIIELNDKNKLKEILQKILTILCEPKNEITLFELENSGILIGLCNYFEPIFKSQYDKLNIENDNELQKNINMNELLPSPLIQNKNNAKK